jgi:twitching motility protein PilI
MITGIDLVSGSRLILLASASSEQSAGIVVERVLGLRNLAQFKPAETAAPARSWHVAQWRDDEGATWQEIDLGRLAADPAFLQVSA